MKALFFQCRFFHRHGGLTTTPDSTVRFFMPSLNWIVISL
jgi:hypothetical protein